MAPQLGKILILAGLVLLAAGLLLSFSSQLSFLRVGRLPGDIVAKKGNFTFYFPITTSILLSLLLTLIFWIFSRK
jgi:hypothetical protein